MLGTLFPFLRAAAASEIAKAFGPSDSAPPDAQRAAPQAKTPPPAPADPLAPLMPGKPTAVEAGLAGLAMPRPLSVKEAALPDAPLSAPLTRASDPGDTVRRAPAIQIDAPLPAPLASALRAALPGAMDEAMAYGAFPFTLGGAGASAASLVIFNAAMSPSWPPALRPDLLTDPRTIRLAGAQLAEMSPQDAEAFLARMAGLFGFLLHVKKRLSRSRQDEKESLLGLFALFGVAMDTLVKGLQMAFDLTAEQRAVLERVAQEASGQPSAGPAARHRLKL